MHVRNGLILILRGVEINPTGKYHYFQSSFYEEQYLLENPFAFNTINIYLS